MARPRTALDILEARGSYKDNPKKLAEIHGAGIVEIDSPELGAPPPDMTPMEQHCWTYLVQCHIPGYLMEIDRPYVEMAARLCAIMKTTGIQSMTQGELGKYELCLSKLGMNPADRGRLKARQLSQIQKPANAFDDLENEA